MGDSRISATGSEALPHHRAPHHVIARGICKEYNILTYLLCCVYRAPPLIFFVVVLLSCCTASLGPP